jgi:hypothetical protein
VAPPLVHKFAVETSDGLLTDYNTPTPYLPGSVRYTLNGRLHVFGYAEGGGTLVKLDAPPQPGDVVSFWYTPL